MRIVSFEIEGERSFGALREGSVVDLRRRLGLSSVIELLGDLEASRESLARSEADFSLDQVVLLPPVPQPGKILCVGVNYRDRNDEYGDGSEARPYPSLFTRTPGSLVGHGAPLLRPPESTQFDYEGEIALVIGRGGRRIPRDDAHAHIAGLCCLNDGSVRDWMRHGKFNVTQGKNFDRSGAMGPFLVSVDELDPRGVIDVETRINGEVRQRDRTDNMSFPFDFLIHYISTFTTLYPGDVISTGTPRGAGIHQTPPLFLQPGDVVEVEVSGVGVLRNPVADDRV